MRWPDLTRGDLAIGIAVVLLLWFLGAPALRARSFRNLVDAAASDVEGLRDAARSTRQTTGRWPPPTSMGIAPPALSAAFPGDSAFVRPGYTLEWSGLSVVEYVEVPVAPTPSAPGDDAPPDSVAPEVEAVVRDIGAIVVHSADEDLLASLLDRFGSDASYVRGSTWTLVVPSAPDGSP
jgi:hypothetical protein